MYNTTEQKSKPYMQGGGVEFQNPLLNENKDKFNGLSMVAYTC